ncbi:MAG TPA: MmgE/PrpD family protein [Alphaproteobacteria bacterium]|nr:MmgE/PrpD family protein [Alphaproteobacteria bacterium]
MGVTRELGQLVASTGYDALTPSVIERAKWAIMDGVAAMLAGSTEPASVIVTSLIQEFGGAPMATIVGRGVRTTLPWAAYVNGTMAHALDYDDISWPMGGHPTAPLLPVILSLGEHYHVTGREALLAYVVGFEVEAKLGRAVNMVHYEKGWHPTATLGTFGAAAAAGKLLQLNSEELTHAFGIAASEASGLKENFGTMTKPLHAGHCAKNGLLAALLAKRGFTAAPEALEGRFGFGNLFVGPGVVDFTSVTKEFGNPWELASTGVVFKAYPCCGSTHAAIDAMLALRTTYGLSAEAIAGIEARVQPNRVHVLVHPHPRTGLEAKFSLEYCVATAALEGELRLRHFADAWVRRSQNQALTAKTKGLVHSDSTNSHSEVTVYLQDGRRLTHRVAHAKGITTIEELHRKYRDCAEGVLASEAIGRSLSLIEHLEEVGDLALLPRSLG